MVNIIGTPRDRRAKIISRNIPVFNLIEVTQQGTVQRFYCLRVGKVYRQITPFVFRNKRFKLWATGNQGREVIAATVAVTRVQAAFFLREDFLLFHLNDSPVKCGKRTISENEWLSQSNKNFWRVRYHKPPGSAGRKKPPSALRPMAVVYREALLV